MSDRVETIAQAHLYCEFPSKPCDPIEAALLAGLGDRDTMRLAAAIEGYHNPLTRVLINAAAKVLPPASPEGSTQ